MAVPRMAPPSTATSRELPFSRFVVSVVDRQIAEIDSGIWQPPVVEATEYAGPASLPQMPQLAQGHAMALKH